MSIVTSLNAMSESIILCNHSCITQFKHNEQPGNIYSQEINTSKYFKYICTNDLIINGTKYDLFAVRKLRKSCIS